MLSARSNPDNPSRNAEEPSAFWGDMSADEWSLLASSGPTPGDSSPPAVRKCCPCGEGEFMMCGEKQGGHSEV